jgi:hypothetical protein
VRVRARALVVTESGLEVLADPAAGAGNGGGLLVNCELCARAGIYAAGDAAAPPHPALGRGGGGGGGGGLRGTEHAVRSGLLAGEVRVILCYIILIMLYHLYVHNETEHASRSGLLSGKGSRLML